MYALKGRLFENVRRCIETTKTCKRHRILVERKGKQWDTARRSYDSRHALILSEAIQNRYTDEN